VCNVVQKNITKIFSLHIHTLRPSSFSSGSLRFVHTTQQFNQMNIVDTAIQLMFLFCCVSLSLTRISTTCSEMLYINITYYIKLCFYI
jgi:hypothetical protein